MPIEVHYTMHQVIGCKQFLNITTHLDKLVDG